MEIERKFLINPKALPFSLSDYPSRHMEQGYLCREPVVRIRKDEEEYILTYKSKGLMVREEYNLPLNAEAYAQLREKIEGKLIQKTRYLIPEKEGLTIELDVFEGELAPLYLAEVEFPDEAAAGAYQPPAWFGEEVTHTSRYHNSQLSI